MSSIDPSRSSVQKIVSDMPDSFKIPTEGAVVALAPAGGVRNKVEAPANNIVPFRTIKPGEQGMPPAPKGEAPGGQWLLDPVSGTRTYLPPNATLSQRPDVRQAILNFYKAAFQQNPNAVIGGITLRDFRDYVERELGASSKGPEDWRRVRAFEERLFQALQEPMAPPPSRPVVPPIPTVVPPETTISGPPASRTEIPLSRLPSGDFSQQRRRATEILGRQRRQTEELERGEASAQRASAAQRNTSTMGELRAKLQGLSERVASFGMDPSVVGPSRLVSELTPKLERIDSLDRGLRALRPGQQLVIGAEIVDPGKARVELTRLQRELKDGLARLEAAVATLGNGKPEDFEQNDAGLWLPKGAVSSNREGRPSSSPTPDAGGPGSINPPKPPTGGNDRVPDPDDDPEGWEAFMQRFRDGLESGKFSKDDLSRMESALKDLRSDTAFTNAQAGELRNIFSFIVKNKGAFAGVPWNRIGVVAGILTSAGLAGTGILSIASPETFSKVMSKLLGRPIAAIPEGVPKLDPENLAKGGASVGPFGNVNYTVGVPEMPGPDVALENPRIYLEELNKLNGWLAK